MSDHIEMPPVLQGEAEEQLEQLYRYLHRLAQELNIQLDGVGGNDLTDSERVVMRKILGNNPAGKSEQQAEQGTERETLKSLIIKTADFVQTSLQEYRLKLLDETFADGQFGKYVRRTGLKVDITTTGIQQNYSFQEIVQGLKRYEINSKSYIYSGLLRTVDEIPVYGVAIGKGVVSFAEDGTETYVDENKVAELTADELSFWQDDEKIASYKGDRISFFFDEEEIFYIAEGKVYCAGDMEITADGSLTIKTGATFELESENFSVDADGDVTIKGNIEIPDGKDLMIKTGGTFSIETGQGETPQFSIDAQGNATFAGELDAAGGTFAGELSADCIKGGTLILGGEDNENGTLVIQDDQGQQIGKWDKDGISASSGSFKGTIESGSTISASISATNISGGTLTLGGQDNASGKLEVKDANGTVIGKWDKDGISASSGSFKGTIESGSTISASISATNISGGKLTLGGNANASGTLEVKDANGTVIGKWDKDGISASSGSFSGDISGATGTFTGSITGATGEFAGSLHTGNWYFDSSGMRHTSGFAVCLDGSRVGNFGIAGNTTTGIVYFYSGSNIITLDVTRKTILVDDLSATKVSAPTGDISTVNANLVDTVSVDAGTVDATTVNATNVNADTVTAEDVVPDSTATCRLGSSSNYWDSAYIDRLHQGSSKMIKHDTEKMESYGDVIDRLAPVTFRYNSDKKGEKRFGLIWEDAVKVLPEICHQDPEAKDPDRGKTITYMDLIPIMLKEIQDLRARVAELERRL